MGDRVHALLRRFQTWRGGSANRSIFAAALTVGLFTVLSRSTGVVKQFVVAWWFGTADAYDAFLAAFLIATFLVGVAESSFNAAFIPTYVATLKREGEEAASRLFASVLFATLVLLTILSLALFALEMPLLRATASGFAPAKQALARALVPWLLPMLPAGGVAALFGAVLNARGRYALAALAPLFVSLFPIVVLIACGRDFGIYALAVGSTVGALAAPLLLAWGLHRAGLPLKPRWHGWSPALREVARQLLPMVAGALIMTSSVAVDQAMAAGLGPGSVAALSYGTRFPSLVIGIGALSIGTAVLPQFSSMVADGDFLAIRHTLRTWTRAIVLVVVPLTVVLVALSHPLVELFFQRGDFTAADTLLVGRVQALFFLQAPFFLLGILGVRLLSALGLNRVLLAISSINVVTNFAGNWLLERVMGLPGIALSTTLVYACSMTIILAAVYRKTPRENRAPRKNFAEASGAAAGSAGAPVA